MADLELARMVVALRLDASAADPMLMQAMAMYATVRALLAQKTQQNAEFRYRLTTPTKGGCHNYVFYLCNLQLPDIPANWCLFMVWESVYLVQWDQNTPDDQRHYSHLRQLHTTLAQQYRKEGGTEELPPNHWKLAYAVRFATSTFPTVSEYLLRTV
jgi:hypothetical protein